MPTPTELQARLDELNARRDAILNGKNVRSTDFDGQRTEYFAPDLKAIDAEIGRIEAALGTEPQRKRAAIGMYY